MIPVKSGANNDSTVITANVRGEDATISYRSISSMPGWYIIVQLANKKISNITQYFSAWGVVDKELFKKS